MDIRNYLITRILPYVVLLQVIFAFPLFIWIFIFFWLALEVQLVSTFIVFIFILSMNILNFVGILCFKKQRIDLYFYCAVGMVVSILLFYFSYQNNFE